MKLQRHTRIDLSEAPNYRQILTCTVLTGVLICSENTCTLVYMLPESKSQAPEVPHKSCQAIEEARTGFFLDQTVLDIVDVVQCFANWSFSHCPKQTVTTWIVCIVLPDSIALPMLSASVDNEDTHRQLEYFAPWDNSDVFNGEFRDEVAILTEINGAVLSHKALELMGAAAIFIRSQAMRSNAFQVTEVDLQTTHLNDEESLFPSLLNAGQSASGAPS